MKKVFLILIAFFLVQASQAQVSFGLRGGMNFSSLPEKTYELNEHGESSIRSLSDANTGFHVGVMSQIRLMGIFIQPELLFVSTSNDLVLQRQGMEDDYYKQRFRKMDIPVLVGTSFGPLRLGAGPVASILLNKSSDLPDEAGFKERFNPATFGFQLGVGINLGNIALDFKYENNLSRLGDSIEIGEREYDFDTRPRQYILSIGLLF